MIPEANRAFVAERLRHRPGVAAGLIDGASRRVRPGSASPPSPSPTRRSTPTGPVATTTSATSSPSAPFLLFHSGDAVPYEGMADELLRLAAGRPLDVALLPINGRLPERRVPGNFWGDEAATFAHDVGARLVVPMHYEMFAFNTETPELFVATAETARPAVPRAALRRVARSERTLTAFPGHAGRCWPLLGWRLVARTSRKDHP